MTLRAAQVWPNVVASIAALIVVVGLVPPAAATPTFTYNVNLLEGSGSGAATVTGFIETDAIGTLDQADIIDWRLTIAQEGQSFTFNGPDQGNDSKVTLVGSAVVGTGHDLTFNFAASGSCLAFNNTTIPPYGDVVVSDLEWWTTIVCHENTNPVSQPTLKIFANPTPTENPPPVFISLIYTPDPNNLPEFLVGTRAVPVPEPNTLMLFATALVALGLIWRLNPHGRYAANA